MAALEQRLQSEKLVWSLILQSHWTQLLKKFLNATCLFLFSGLLGKPQVFIWDALSFRFSFVEIHQVALWLGHNSAFRSLCSNSPPWNVPNVNIDIKKQEHLEARIEIIFFKARHCDLSCPLGGCRNALWQSHSMVQGKCHSLKGLSPSCVGNIRGQLSSLSLQNSVHSPTQLSEQRLNQLC